MFPMRTRSIFKSRWMALLWAAGIIWFAYDFAGSVPADTATDKSAGSNADQNAISQAFGS